MTYKQFIDSLSPQQRKAFASQNGFKEWRTRDATLYLHKSESGKQTFGRIYG